MTTARTPESTVTFEQFMAGMQELRKSQQEAHQQALKEMREAAREDRLKTREADRLREEADRRLEEEMRKSREEFDQRMREADRRMEEEMRKSREEFDQQMRKLRKSQKATDKRMGELTNRFGDMVESMVMPNLLAKFEKLDFTFTKANRTEIKDRIHDIFLEVDALLENGDNVMAVEIKTKPNDDDVNKHVERMEKLRRYADLHTDKRAYWGAIAGVVFSDSAKIYALKKGFYVIEPSGDTFTITAPEGVYRPTAW